MKWRKILHFNNQDIQKHIKKISSISYTFLWLWQNYYIIFLSFSVILNFEWSYICCNISYPTESIGELHIQLERWDLKLNFDIWNIFVRHLSPEIWIKRSVRNLLGESLFRSHKTKQQRKAVNIVRFTLFR